jgi:hypothetical protein
MRHVSLYDENLEVLTQFAQRGIDLDCSRTVDFQHIFPNEAAARLFAVQVAGEGVAIKVSEYEEEQSWNTQVSVVIVPTCDLITETEQRLDSIARVFGGRSDGWGFMSS